jgi:aspartyl-tRNA(Asn)/glutamyl-tRNA(Gln) amidotransferase subunit C
MALSITDVRKVAKLAHLRLQPEQEELALKQINGIMNWIEQLQSVNTDGIEPQANVADITLCLRKDIVNDGGYPDKILKNAPEETQGYFVVPKVVE